MKLDHLGFITFLLSLLIAPKVPLAFAGLAGKSAVSLGLVGLVFWSLLCPGHILKRKKWEHSFPIKGLMIFCVYALSVSLLSMRMVSIIYASQYILYVWLSVFLMGGYIQHAIETKQLHISYKIIALVGLVYALGVIVSLWTGPFYPRQTLDVGRLWGGLFIQQGVGFAEGTNGAGAVLIIFCAFLWLVYRYYWRRAWLFGVVATLALLATISRSAIFSFFIVISVFVIVGILRSIIVGKLTRRALRFAVRTVVVLAMIAVGGHLLLKETEAPRLIYRTAIGGFGIGDQGGIVPEDMKFRMSLWKRGISEWADRSAKEQLLGLGFRGSFELMRNDSAWITQHNAYIAILNDFGIIGITLFIVTLMGGLLQLGYRWLIYRGRNEERAALLSLAALMAHNTTEVFFYSPGLISLLVLMLVLANSRRAKFIEVDNSNNRQQYLL